MHRRGWLSLVVVSGLLVLAAACSSSHTSASSPLSSTTTSAAARATSTTGAASSQPGGSFCKDVASAKSQLLAWTTATPGSSAAAAEPLAHAFQTIAGEAPAAVKSQVQDLAATFVQLEKYDTVTDPNTLLQEGPLTNGHVIPDSNALGTYADAHC